MDLVSVYVTCPDEACALRIARDLVERRLVACANILPPIRSVYRWEGAVHDEPEAAMLLKTRRDLFAEVEAAVRAQHPYEVPCIVAFDLAAASAPYLAWVASETTREG